MVFFLFIIFFYTNFEKPNTKSNMAINRLETSTLLSEVKKTWHILGDQDFYLELLKLNNNFFAILEEEISTQIIYEQIFLFLTTNQELVLEEKLISIRNKFKESKNQQLLDLVLKLVCEKFQINKESLLTPRRIKNSLLVDSRMILFTLLSNYFLISQAECSRLLKLDIHQTQISRYVSRFNNLNEKIPSEKALIDSYKEIIITLKTQTNG